MSSNPEQIHPPQPLPGQEMAPTLLGQMAAVWALLGLTALLSQALMRLTPLALEIFQQPLSLLQWAILVAWVLFMAVSEGYKGFQKAFAPRFAARARWLSAHPRPLHGLLATFFCMGFFGATRKRKIVAWALTSMIIVFILMAKMLPQPWRGIIDAGVVVGLSWGLLAVFWFWVQAVVFQRSEADPELGPAELQA